MKRMLIITLSFILVLITSCDSGDDKNNADACPIEGTWEHYSFEVGNIIFLMLADRNDLPPPIGRGSYGGYPAGAISEETFSWWRKKIKEN